MFNGFTCCHTCLLPFCAYHHFVWTVWRRYSSLVSIQFGIFHKRFSSAEHPVHFAPLASVASLSFLLCEKWGREPREGGDGGRTRPGGESENGGRERRRRNRTGRGGRERRGGESPDKGGDRSPERYNGEEGREGTGQAGNRAQRRSQTKTATGGKGARTAPRTPHDPAGPTGDGAKEI